MFPMSYEPNGLICISLALDIHRDSRDTCLIRGAALLSLLLNCHYYFAHLQYTCRNNQAVVTWVPGYKYRRGSLRLLTGTRFIITMSAMCYRAFTMIEINAIMLPTYHYKLVDRIYCSGSVYLEKLPKFCFTEQQHRHWR